MGKLWLSTSSPLQSGLSSCLNPEPEPRASSSGRKILAVSRKKPCSRTRESLTQPGPAHLCYINEGIHQNIFSIRLHLELYLHGQGSAQGRSLGRTCLKHRWSPKKKKRKNFAASNLETKHKSKALPVGAA